MESRSCFVTMPSKAVAGKVKMERTPESFCLGPCVSSHYARLTIATSEASGGFFSSQDPSIRARLKGGLARSAHELEN